MRKANREVKDRNEIIVCSLEYLDKLVGLDTNSIIMSFSSVAEIFMGSP